MKEIVVMSGKGGTGKTSITAALGVIAGKQAVIADCDVDAANLHLLYKPQHRQKNEFRSGKTAVIDYDKCGSCNVCREKCRFDAISEVNGKYIIDEITCEGCSVCYYVCPDRAITMKEDIAGYWYFSTSRFGHYFIHAKLEIGKENSGKLVSKVKEASHKTADQFQKQYILMDGPPGIGCPVISSFSGGSHVLIITEPTQSALHDLKRLVDLIEFFKMHASCVINKSDLNKQICSEIEAFCQQHSITVITHLPYHPVFYYSLQGGKTVMETDESMIKDKINQIWEYLKDMEKSQ